jgi:hypothetical protein
MGEMIMRKNEMTLQEALAAWSARRTPVGASSQHIAPSALYQLLTQPSDAPTNEPLLQHLTRCPLCLRELKEIAQSIADAAGWDIAVPKAAASEMRGTIRIPTEGGKYTIIIRRSVADAQQGVITVEVAAPYRAELEGKSVVLRDGQGRLRLHGRIIDGEVSQAVEDLTGLIPRFLVEIA